MRKLAKILLILGGIDLGLKGVGYIFGKDLFLIDLFRNFSTIVPIVIYILIGLAAI